MKRHVELTLTLVVLFVSMISAPALQKPADAQQNPRGNPPVSAAGATKKTRTAYGSGGNLASVEKGVKPDLVADGGSPKPTEDPPPPCLVQLLLHLQFILLVVSVRRWDLLHC